jgi:hypothetical protein
MSGIGHQNSQDNSWKVPAKVVKINRRHKTNVENKNLKTICGFGCCSDETGNFTEKQRSKHAHTGRAESVFQGIPVPVRARVSAPSLLRDEDAGKESEL